MEYMPDFRLHRPTTVAEAVKLRASEPASFFVAGGTDLVVNIRRGIQQAKSLVDLSAIEDLHSITVDDEGVHIGAAVSLEILASHDAVARDYAAVAAAAAAVAGPTHRAYGTLGGNLCLDTRCLYYNQSEWWRQSNDYCLKERGDVCHVAPGGNFCFEAQEQFAEYGSSDSGPSNGGQVFILIDPKGYHDNFARRVEGLFGLIDAQEGTRIPGDRRYANRARSATEGVECQAALHQQILEMKAG